MVVAVGRLKTQRLQTITTAIIASSNTNNDNSCPLLYSAGSIMELLLIAWPLPIVELSYGAPGGGVLLLRSAECGKEQSNRQAHVPANFTLHSTKTSCTAGICYDSHCAAIPKGCRIVQHKWYTNHRQKNGRNRNLQRLFVWYHLCSAA